MCKDLPGSISVSVHFCKREKELASPSFKGIQTSDEELEGYNVRGTIFGECRNPGSGSEISLHHLAGLCFSGMLSFL